MIISNFFYDILSSKMGSLSTKRLITVVCTVLLSIGFLANLFGGYKIDEFIFNGVMIVIISSMGITGVEKFSPQLTTSSKSDA